MMDSETVNGKFIQNVLSRYERRFPNILVGTLSTGKITCEQEKDRVNIELQY